MTETERRTPAEMLRRWICLALGLAIMALGVACSIKAGLGTSPISSTPYVVSLFSPITVGQITIIMHCVFILLQILLLRRRYRLFQLLQLPVALLFGVLTDGAVWLLDSVSPAAYWQQWVLCLIGIVLVGFGVSLEVLSEAAPLAGEGTVLAFCQVLPIKFGTMKILFDVSLVVCACVLSLLFLHTLAGVREGTVAAALLVGTFARRFNTALRPRIQPMLRGRPSP